MAKQCTFDWFDSMLGQETKVRTMNRWLPSRILEVPSAWSWDGSDKIAKSRVDRCRRDAVGGKLAAISYDAWLKFYTPLCEKGVN